MTDQTADGGNEQIETRVVPMGDTEQKSAVGDFIYQVGASGVAELGLAGAIAGAAVARDKVTGNDDPPSGKHHSDS